MRPAGAAGIRRLCVVDLLRRINSRRGQGSAAVWAAVAQIQATLALAAASTLGTTAAEGHAWADVAGTKHDPQARLIYHDRPIDYDRRDSIEVHLLIVFASLAVSCRIEEATSWRIRKFVRTDTSLPDNQARRRRTRPYPQLTCCPAISTTPRPHPPRSSAH